MRGGEWKRSGRLVGADETSGRLAKWCRHHWRNLNTLNLPNGKGWPQRHKVSCWQEHQSLLCQKEKKQSTYSQSRDCEMEEGKGGQEQHFDKKQEGQSESIGQKEWALHWWRWEFKKRKKASKKSLCGRWRKYKRLSGRKESPGKLGKPWFYFMSGQIWNMKGNWNTKEPLVIRWDKMS